MGAQGFNALQIILASGFTGITELGDLPESVLSHASLPEKVSLVRANENINFKLAAKRGDPVRSDTTIFRWIIEVTPTAIQYPDYFLNGSLPNTFQVLKRITPSSTYPALSYIRLPIKFISRFQATSNEPELWLSTVILHNELSVATHLRKGIRVGA